ncbi:MAG: energy-coupling factor transporter ATPase [Lachnospiraceae bacterium]|nr:energy-coupling factor transporter ATPase [Lachnospiraceae bacterium]
MGIIVNHVNYIYNEGTALESVAVRDVSFAVNEGEFIGVIGHTGCGKSTLMQLINGILKPSSGGIYYNGQDVYDDDFDLKTLRSKVGLVFQYPEHQLFEVDVFSDVCFGPNNLGLPKSEVQLRAYDALKAVKLPEDCFYSSPFDLSGGEKRRVAIAGVLAMKPEILILDEPTAGLDPAGRLEILELIKELQKKSGISIILVSHSMEDVAEYADRIIVIDKGSIVFDDTPENVFTKYDELDALGLSVPSPTRVLYKLRDKGIPAKVKAITTDEAVEEIMRLYADKYGRLN